MGLPATGRRNRDGVSGMPSAAIAFALVVGVLTFIIGVAVGRPILIYLDRLGVG